MSKVLWGFTMGLIAGLLLAPDKGSETRRRVARKANELKDKFEDFVDTITEKLDSFKDDGEQISQGMGSESRSFAGDVQNGVL